IAGGIVLVHHHADWVLHTTEGRRKNWLLLNDRLFHANDVRKQHHLFLHHVGGEFLGQSLEDGAHLPKFRMVLTVHRIHFLRQRAEAGNLLLGVLVVSVVDVGNQVRQRFYLPIAGRLFSS